MFFSHFKYHGNELYAITLCFCALNLLPLVHLVRQWNSRNFLFPLLLTGHYKISPADEETGNDGEAMFVTNSSCGSPPPVKFHRKLPLFTGEKLKNVFGKAGVDATRLFIPSIFFLFWMRVQVKASPSSLPPVIKTFQQLSPLLMKSLLLPSPLLLLGQLEGEILFLLFSVVVVLHSTKLVLPPLFSSESFSGFLAEFAKLLPTSVNSQFSQVHIDLF